MSNQNKPIKQGTVKVIIELPVEAATDIETMARYLHTTVPRTIAALLSDSPTCGFMDQEGDLNWEPVINFLRDTYGDTARLREIESYVDAMHENNELPTVQERSRNNFGQLENLDAFLKWKKGQFDHN